jgi:hypothetical protein
MVGARLPAAATTTRALIENALSELVAARRALHRALDVEG